MSSLCVLWRGKRLHILRANCYCGSNRWLCVFGVTVSWCPNSESFNAQKIINYVSLIWLLDPLPATGIQPHMDLPLGWRDVFHTLSATTSMALWPIPWCWYYDSCIVIYGYIYICACFHVFLQVRVPTNHGFPYVERSIWDDFGVLRRLLTTCSPGSLSSWTMQASFASLTNSRPASVVEWKIINGDSLTTLGQVICTSVVCNTAVSPESIDRQIALATVDGGRAYTWAVEGMDISLPLCSQGSRGEVAHHRFDDQFLLSLDAKGEIQEGGFWSSPYSTVLIYMGMGQNPGTVPWTPSHSWDLWMFIPLKMVSIGIDPYPYFTMPSPPIMTLRASHVGTSSRPWASKRMHVLNCLSGLIRRPQPAPHEQSAQTLKVGEPYCYHRNDFLLLFDIYIYITYIFVHGDTWRLI